MCGNERSVFQVTVKKKLWPSSSDRGAWASMGHGEEAEWICCCCSGGRSEPSQGCGRKNADARLDLVLIL